MVISREKLDRIINLTEKIQSNDKNVNNMIAAVKQCIIIIDDLQEDKQFLESEVERLSFELQDKNFEKGRSNRRR